MFAVCLKSTQEFDLIFHLLFFRTLDYAFVSDRLIVKAAEVSPKLMLPSQPLEATSIVSMAAGVSVIDISNDNIRNIDATTNLLSTSSTTTIEEFKNEDEWVMPSSNIICEPQPSLSWPSDHFMLRFSFEILP